MPRTLDDIYDRLNDLLDAINNGIGRNSGNGNHNSSISDVGKIVNDFRQSLGDLTDNLDKYNTTFEKDIIANQEKNAKEIKDIIKQQDDLFNQYIKYQKKQIKEQQKILNDVNATEQQKKDAQNKIHRYEKQIDDKRQRFNERDETKEAKEQINIRRREIVEDQEDKRRFRNTKYGRNISKIEDMAGNTRMYGKQMQSIGGKMGGKFGGAVGKAGSHLTKFAGALGKAIPVIGWVITALQLLGDAAKAATEAEAELQDIQNERNTARTNRNIERSKIDTQSLIDRLETATANGLATFETESNYAIGQQNVANMKSIAAAQVKTGSITNGYNAAAWDALNSQLDIEAESQKVGLRFLAESAKTERANALRNLEFSGRERVRDVDKKLVDQDLREKETELDKRDMDYTREHPYGTTTMRIAGSSTDADNVYNPGGKDYGNVDPAIKRNVSDAATRGVIASIPLLGDVVSPLIDAPNARLDTLAKQRLANERNQLNSSKAIAENTSEMANAIKTSSNRLSDAMTDSTLQIKEATITAVNTIEHTYAKFAQDIENWTLNFEKISLDSAASKGITTGAQAQGYSRFMNKTVQTASKWGLNEQDVIAMQNQYGQGTGRSILGTTTDIDKTAAMGKYLGDNGLAVELSNSTEIFNMGMSTTMELMWDMTKKVNKMGLDGRKYMKDMTQNLKIAQKYNFKGGVKGMMEMAKWAQNVRFDMNKLPALLEDILNGGLEGIIEKGAKLQVLGGNFAMGADPLAMMYEAMEDPAALAKRINSMTEGMGTFNSETGQVEFNGMEQRQLQLLAQYTGQDLTDIKNQASYGIKSAKMGNIFNSGLNEDQKASLVNKAYFENGQWKVNDFKGNKLNVSDVTAENIGDLQAETHEGFVEQALQEIVGWQDKSVGLSTKLQAEISNALVETGEYFKNQRERYQKQLKEEENINTWAERASTYWNEATKAFKTFKEDITNPKVAEARALEDIKIAMNTVSGYVEIIAKKMKAEIKNANSNSEMNRMAASIVSGFAENGKTKDLDKLKKMATVEYGSKDFDKLYGDIIGKGSSTQDAWFRKLSDTQKDAIRNNPELFYNVIKEMSKNGNNGVENRHLSALHTSDGVMSSNGRSMLTSASNITPINDGSVQLAKSDPQDVALFAKTGGPFDTLFNGIFAKINEISNVLPRSMEYIMPRERILNEVNHSKGTANNSKIQIDTVKIELNGKLELSNSNGQSVDIINEIKNNPILLRTLTQLISESMEKNINGGKSTYTGGVVKPRFN